LILSLFLKSIVFPRGGPSTSDIKAQVVADGGVESDVKPDKSVDHGVFFHEQWRFLDG